MTRHPWNDGPLIAIIGILLSSCHEEGEFGDADAPFNTSQIELVTDQDVNGWRMRLYRNLAYSCAEEGHQSFALVTPPGREDNEPLPLWMFIHGGGAVRYLPGGTLEGTAFPLDEDDLTEIFDGFATTAWPPTEGLAARIAAREEPFRFLAVSLCDGDVHSGVGLPDENNPNRGPTGELPRTDGLLANQSALARTREIVTTTHVIAQGCSAGSAGAATLAHALGRKGQRLSGAILDSAVLHPNLQRLYDLGETGNDCFSSHVPDPSRLFARVGIYAQPGMFPHEAIARGDVLTPLFHTWSRGDPLCCGETEVLIAGETMTGCEAMHRPMEIALSAHSPAVGESVSQEVCVGESCATHCWLGTDLPDTSGRPDALQEVIDWVEAQLTGPPP